jgi:hypothetical protein
MLLTFVSFGEKIAGEKKYHLGEDKVMRKVKYAKPRVVGCSSVHPC